MSLLGGSWFYSTVFQSQALGPQQANLEVLIEEAWIREAARATAPKQQEAGQPSAIRGLPRIVERGEGDVFVVDDFEAATGEGEERRGWVGALARPDPNKAFRDANLGGGIMSPSREVRLDTMTGPDGGFLRASYCASPLSPGPSTWAVRVSLKDRNLPLKLHEFDGIFLKARGQGIASVHISVRDDAPLEKAPTLATMIPLTSDWRAYYLPWRNMQILTNQEDHPVEFQDISLSEETVVAVWIFGAADFYQFPGDLTGVVDVDDVAVFRSDPLRDGRLALGPGFSGIVPGDAGDHLRHRSAEEDERPFSLLGIILNDGEWRTDGTISSNEDSLAITGRLSVRSKLFTRQMSRVDHIEMGVAILGRRLTI